MGLFTDGFKLLKKASEPLYKTPKSIQETIEIMAVAENGIFEVSKNKYSKCYRFQDINYTTATEDEQIGIFERYCKFLNSLDCNYKITINNKNKNMDELRDKVLIAEKNDGFNNYRSIYNDIIEEKIIEGRQGIEQERYLTITIERKNFEEAKAQFEMDVWSLDPNDSKGMIREKGEFMLGLCEQCIGDSLNSRQKSIIDRCVRKLYIDIARSKEKYIPVMSDFYDILMAQPEDEAKDIALSLELFVNGSLNIFNHQTNVDVDNRFTVYGIRDLGTELSPITMLVMMESIQNRIVENGQKGKATWLYIDEFHVLLNSEYSAKYLQQLWKKVRKQGGLCTGITQNVVDLLQNYTATTMLANSEFVALLKQANTDSSKMAEVIGVSEAQLRFVTNTASGMGLIKCGSVVIPFDNQISKDTDLYRLYNTNIHEKIAEQKKKEAKFAD